LAEALYAIVDEQTYDLIILECSGLSNPLDVISVLSAPALVSKLGVSHCLCVVDAAHAEKMLQAAELAKAQVATADILLINKEDRLEPHKRETVSALLRTHAPRATVHWTTFGDLDEETCRALLTDPAPTHQVCACGHHHHAHEDHHQAHTHTLPASFYTVAVPLPELPNRACAESLLRALPAPVIRAKGFIHLTDGGWHVLHRVYDTIDVIPYAAAPSTGSLLICIGQHLEAETICTVVTEIYVTLNE
jgi:G3E family GTPase